MPDPKPIKRTFPTSEVNRLAEREYHVRRHHAPSTPCTGGGYDGLGSVFHTIALYALTDEDAGATAKLVTVQQGVVAKATCVNRTVAFGFCQPG